LVDGAQIRCGIGVLMAQIKYQLLLRALSD
jgi:hypothetical protein